MWVPDEVRATLLRRVGEGYPVFGISHPIQGTVGAGRKQTCSPRSLCPTDGRTAPGWLFPQWSPGSSPESTPNTCRRTMIYAKSSTWR